MTNAPRHLALGLGAATILLGTVGSAAAAVPTPALAIAPPEAAVVGFASPYVIVVRGQALSFANADTVAHTVTSLASKPKRMRFGRVYYTIRVPLFDSGSVSGAAVGDVKGASGLKPGQYAFYCSVHTGMKGTLVVEASPVG